MLFNTFDFVIFFTVVYGLYRVFDYQKQNWLLLFASYFFYAYWDYRFTALLLTSTIVGYLTAKAINTVETKQSKTVLLLISVIFNLGFLGFFKYYNFLIRSLNVPLEAWQIELSTLAIILPVGISFYTFQSMSYTIDVYRNKLAPASTFKDFALYVSFFPQLVAGPIERATNLLPQITTPRTIDVERVTEGLYLIFWGYFKKVYMADNLALLVNYVFDNYERLSGVEIIIGVVAFAFQIYGDFSGYTDIARGLCKVMGFDLMQNFNLPYFAISPSDFWRRWHISLSTWLRDYLYISLGGNRHGTWYTYRNLVLTMVLGGLWHGAAWTFVLWGLYHGILLVLYRPFSPLINRLLDTSSPTFLQRGGKFVAICVMFIFTCIGWAIFRATSIDQLFSMSHAILFDAIPTGSLFLRMVAYLGYYAGLIILLDAIQYLKNDLFALSKMHPIWQSLFYFLAIVLFLSSGVTGGKDFIYFQF